jgi:hypothetical protein
MRYKEIFEGREGFLYHGTSIFYACEAIKDNSLEARTSHRKFKLLLGPEEDNKYDETNKSGVWGVSLTRNSKIAFAFGNVVFVLDQRILSYTHKLIPVDYWQKTNRKKNLTRNPTNNNSIDFDYEFEEFCIGDIKPLNRYCKKILIRKQSIIKFERDYGSFDSVMGGENGNLNAYGNLEIIP